MASPADLCKMTVTVVVELRDPKAREVARDVLETTGRDLQLKMLLLADSLVSATITFAVGRDRPTEITLTGDSLATFLLKE